jgi:hypothetical protein
MVRSPLKRIFYGLLVVVPSLRVEEGMRELTTRDILRAVNGAASHAWGIQAGRFQSE